MAERVSRIIKLKDGTELELSKVTEINSTNSEFIYFDKLLDDTWRICYTKGTLKELSALEGLEIERIG